MLLEFDDYPIHQTPDPIAVPASSDRDFYERYWFNGYNRAGDFYIGVGAAVYPHLDIVDCGVSIVRNGRQHAFHASGRASADRAIEVGPFRLEILRPMRSLRITVEPNETDFSGELLFEGRTANIEEPRHQSMRGIRRMMDTTRFTQFGTWSGRLDYHGESLEIDPADTWATKDRSWGLRPIGGGDQRGAPVKQAGGGLFFLWAPMHFDDRCSHYQLFEDNLGRPMYQVGAHLPVYDSVDAIPGVEDPDVEHLRNLEHQVVFEPGLRMAASGTTASMKSLDGKVEHTIEFEKVFTYRMKGIGYMHPEWEHGRWHGEEAMASEQWALADVDETAFENQHVQHLMRVRMTDNQGGDRSGIGVLEQVMFGPYAPYGFEGAIGA